MSKLAKNIRVRMNQLGFTQKELAEAADISQVMVHKLLAGKSKSSTKLVDIAKVLGVDPSELLYGDLEALSVNVVIDKAEVIFKGVPLISWVSAGDYLDSPDNFSTGDAEEWIPAPKSVGPRGFALRVRGDSMTSSFPGGRSYPDGCIIIIDPDKLPENGSRVVARVGTEYTFKVYAVDAGRRYLRPLNTQYPTIEMNGDEHICGVVVGSFLPE